MSGPIRAFVGANGSGKTLAMVEKVALPALREGRKVFATCRIGSPDSDGWFEDCEPIESAGQLLDVPVHSAVLIDEITSSFPSRQHAALPPDVQRWTNQLRKKDIVFAWTAPNFRRADTMLREVTQQVTTCRAIIGSRYVRAAADGNVVRYDGDGEYWSRMFGMLRGRPGARVKWPNEWPAKNLFRFKTYDSQTFDEFQEDSTKTKKMRPLAKEWYWRRRHQAWRSYDTLEAVLLLAHLDEFGTCVRCGGTRPRPRCTCPRPDRSADAHASALAGAAAEGGAP